MSERVLLCIGTRKGLFVAEASKARGRFALRGPFGPGVAVYSALIDDAWLAPPLRLELQPVLRHEAPAIDRSREDVRRDEGRPGLSERGRPRAREHLVARGRAASVPSSGAASSPRRCSGAGTAATPGRWWTDSAITSTAASGSPAPAGSACTRSCSTATARTSGSPRGGTTLSEDGGRSFAASNKGVGAGFQPDPYPEFGQCVHKIAAPRGCAGPALHAEPRRLGQLERSGRPAARHRRAAQRRLRQDLALDRQGAALGLRLPDRRPSPRRRHRLRDAARAGDPNLPRRSAGGVAQRGRRRLVEAARARLSEEGELLHRAARRDGHRRSQVARRSTSARRPASSGSDATAARNGAACSTRCPRSTA